MPRTILLAVLAAFAVSTSAHAELSQDKSLHAGTTTLTAKCPNRFWYGVGAGLAVGVAKEIADSKEARNRFDAKDVWADLVGSVAGAYWADSMLRPVVKRQHRGYVLGLQARMPLK